jgi:hypothetical protein
VLVEPESEFTAPETESTTMLVEPDSEFTAPETESTAVLVEPESEFTAPETESTTVLVEPDSEFTAPETESTTVLVEPDSESILLFVLESAPLVDVESVLVAVVMTGLTSLATVLICVCSEVFLPFFLNHDLEVDLFWDFRLLLALFFIFLNIGLFCWVCFMFLGEKC